MTNRPNKIPRRTTVGRTTIQWIESAFARHPEPYPVEITYARIEDDFYYWTANCHNSKAGFNGPPPGPDFHDQVAELVEQYGNPATINGRKIPTAPEPAHREGQ